MSIESGEEVDKEVDSYNQHKHPFTEIFPIKKNKTGFSHYI